jgi:hypothetical protein
MPTLEEIEAAKTDKGGWTREQLRRWGVAWPPSRGWKAKLSSQMPDKLQVSGKEL